MDISLRPRASVVGGRTPSGVHPVTVGRPTHYGDEVLLCYQLTEVTGFLPMVAQSSGARAEVLEMSSRALLRITPCS